MTALDDWASWLQQQVNNAETWAQNNPLESSIVIIIAATVITFTANKIYDIGMKH